MPLPSPPLPPIDYRLRQTASEEVKAVLQALGLKPKPGKATLVTSPHSMQIVQEQSKCSFIIIIWLLYIPYSSWACAHKEKTSQKYKMIRWRQALKLQSSVLDGDAPDTHLSKAIS